VLRRLLTNDHAGRGPGTRRREKDDQDR
jgi:hypothetical protein